MIELQRIPTHLGEILKEEFLVPYEMTLNLQNQFDLYKVAKKKKDVLDEVKAYDESVA
jgi:plasmid maintenance system antidote protein VapI